MIACSWPFNSKNLDITIFVFKPTIVIIDDLVHGLKQFSLSTESIGCLQSSILRSIHGNMIIWCGTWQKQSIDKKQQLTESLHFGLHLVLQNNVQEEQRMRSHQSTSQLSLTDLGGKLSMLTEISSMAVLTEHSFLEAYAGESRDGSSAAKFSTGDIVSVNTAITTNSDLNDFCYAILAIFRSRFAKMEGISSGICLKSQSSPRVLCLHVWKSILFCYSWIIQSDQRKWMLPYLERFSIDMKYDIFRVVYVSGERVDKW